MPPRQKMINLLYVILIAMLAINISSDVLDGYKIMNRNFSDRVGDVRAYNDSLKHQILFSATEEHRQEVIEIGNKADSLCNTLHNLKEEIAKIADKDDYKPGELKADDDLNAVPQLFLSATKGKGGELHDALQEFQNYALSCISDTVRRQYAASLLKIKDKSLGMPWAKETFSYLPAIGGVMVLHKIEENVLMTVTEVYQSLLFDKNSEELKAGQRYVLINEGQHVVNDDGTIDVPAVTVSTASTSILYRNYSNVLNVFCAGIAQEKLTASISNGKIYRKGETWIAEPGAAKEVTITIDCIKGGKRTRLFANRYQVKGLPDPTPFLVYNDNGTKKYYGSVPIRRNALMNAIEVGAETSEGPAMSFKIVSFETILIKGGSNKVSSARSAGNRISDAQREQISQIERGDKFYITSITVIAHGSRKQIAPINTIII